MNEVWKPVQGYEGIYEVSNLGRVRSLDRVAENRWGTTRPIPGTMRTIAVKREGYCFVNLFRKSKGQPMYVHRLVALAFLPNPDNLPQVNHKDGDKSNNALTNLEWCTGSDNCYHAIHEGIYQQARGESSAKAVFTEDQVREIRRRWAAGEKQKHLAAEFGTRPGTINKIVHRQRWKHVA